LRLEGEESTKEWKRGRGKKETYNVLGIRVGGREGTLEDI
jgi:hypothetical protein